MSAIGRGIINPFRNRARAVVVVVLLSIVTGFLALMVQASFASRAQISSMEGRVRNLIELREAGAFGTGGFGGDHPIGEDEFSVDTLEAALRMPSARHFARVDEYVYKPDVDPSKKNAYAMVIGLHAGAALRAIGEVDYENARIIAGRALSKGDENANVAIVGRLYAEQRLGLADPATLESAERHRVLNGRSFRVIGIYTTANDFGDNHVFVPIHAFRAMLEDGLMPSDLKHCILHGEMMARQWDMKWEEWKYVIAGEAADERTIEIVAKLGSDDTVVITVYRVF